MDQEQDMEADESPEAFTMDKFIELVIVVTVLVMGMLFIGEAGKTKSFEKTYAINDLKFLSQSFLVEGKYSHLIVNYKGIKGSNLVIDLDSEKISASDAVSLNLLDAAREWLTKFTYSVNWVSDDYMAIGTYKVSPLQEVVGTESKDKNTPYFYVIMSDGKFRLMSALGNSEGVKNEESSA